MAVDLKKPVLVVDDYKTMVRIVRGLLANLGFEDVREAGDGLAALDLMRREKFGLVISDWNMEPITGLELLKRVRADAALKATPFIMITAEAKGGNAAAARAAGADNYIVKPFNAGILRERISAVLGAF